jgi:glutathione S-transferase
MQYEYAILTLGSSTAADVMIGSMFIWKRMLRMPTDRPKLEAYVDRLLARPAAMKLGQP